MRRQFLFVALTISALTLSACSADQSPEAAGPTPSRPNATEPAQTEPTQTEPAQTEPTQTEPTPPVDAWQRLATDFNGFYVAVEESGVDTRAPKTTAEMLAAVDYDFGEGVTLDSYEYNPAGQYVTTCLTGPEDTYLTLTITDGAQLRTLGTGDCDYDDGDLVLELLEPGLRTDGKVGEQVVKGEGLAAGVPALRDNPLDPS